MDFNRILAQLLGTHQGSWGTPELGISERIGDAFGRPRDPVTGGSQNFSGGTQTPSYSSGTGGGGGGSWGGQVAGLNTSRVGGGGGGGGGNTGGGGGNVNAPVNEVDLARRARENRINSAKSTAGQLRGEAQGIFDNILKAVGAFRERSKTQFDSAGQEIVNRSSDILGTNARTARESAGEARARGRALGLGDSSKFQLQNKVQGNLASTQGNTIARRGEEDRSNQGLFQERQDQAQTQEDEAGRYLKSANERAGVVERAGYDTADEVFDSALNDIVNYQRSLAAIKPVQAEGLQQFAPNFSGITNTINGVLEGIGGGNNTGVTNPDMGNPVNPTDIFNILKRNKAPNYLA